MNSKIQQAEIQGWITFEPRFRVSAGMPRFSDRRDCLYKKLKVEYSKQAELPREEVEAQGGLGSALAGVGGGVG